MEMWQIAARQCGAEACANGRRAVMSGDDRFDIGKYHRRGEWWGLSDAEQTEAMRLFSEGYEAERKAVKP